MIPSMKRVSLEEVMALAEGISQWKCVASGKGGATYQGDGDGYTVWSSARRTRYVPKEEPPYTYEEYALGVQMGEGQESRMVWFRHHALVLTPTQTRWGEAVPARRVEGWDFNRKVNDFYHHVEKTTAKR